MADLARLDETIVAELVCLALEEDVGGGDVSTLWTVGPHAIVRAELIAREAGVVAGMAVALAVFRSVDPRIGFEGLVVDGDRVADGTVLAEVSGSAAGILTAERTALNFLQRMSGIATGTARYVEAVEGTGVQILDTRKTAPGLRALDKYAVAAGGGTNHRTGLYDMVLLKENHIQAAGGINAAVAAVRAQMSEAQRDVQVEVEVETLDQLGEALAAGVDRVMLDNMDLDTMREAVTRVGATRGSRPEVEASGGISLETVREVAETGVDMISVGALTHSVAALDLSLLFRDAG